MQANLAKVALMINLSGSNNTATTQANTTKPFSNGEEMRAELAKFGENLGDFKAYDSQLTIAEIKHTRIVKCLYKAVKNAAGNLVDSKFVSSYVRIPTKHLSEEHIIANIAELAPYVLSYLQGIEDAMIKDSHKAGLGRVYCEGLSLAKLIEKLEESDSSSRLTKEKIELWFDDVIQDALGAKFAAKMGLSENSSEQELEKLELILNAYKAKFSSLAGGKTFIKEADCLAMIAVITNCEAEETSLGARFIVRLEKMNMKEEDLLLAL
jgi:hypothetical protein